MTIANYQFCATVQIMGGSVKTKSKPARFVPFADGSICPACPQICCNLSNVLQACVLIQDLRDERHDGIVEMILSSLNKSGFHCCTQNNISLGSSFIKPDIIANSLERKCYVIDPTITSDGGNIATAKSSKIDKWHSGRKGSHVRVNIR
ncbi:unnamed protein product [Lepeophtheirus salmonis]|uniref:(salmon louse) hypothetical protein n=1 Tax=Lepeophtheirus salmonis TaxID=72036 RepID=A0A7R8H0D5_LEPSM|nr:unnamed protein product [Lepeophtheirus salmonis]CAF2789645.1 unnamed protein product [Lepeophtheirus salmonis]